MKYILVIKHPRSDRSCIEQPKKIDCSSGMTQPTSAWMGMLGCAIPYESVPHLSEMFRLFFAPSCGLIQEGCNHGQRDVLQLSHTLKDLRGKRLPVD